MGSRRGARPTATGARRPQRSLVHFSIGDDRMPKAVYHAYGYVKKACGAGQPGGGPAAGLEGRGDRARRRRGDRRASSTTHFPLYVWQTGSGTQSNMNVNEVISNRAIQLLGGELGSKQPVAPERRRQHGAVVATTPSRPRCTSPPCEAIDDQLLPAARRAGRGDRGEGGGMDGRGQDRPHPSGGCGAADGRAGMVRLCARRSATRWRRSRQPRDGLLRAGGRRHRGRHRAERAARASASTVAAKIAELTGQAVRDRAEQVHGAGLARRDGAGACGAARGWRWR